MKKKVLILASLVIAMTATTVKAQLNVGATTAPITTLDVQGNAYIKNNLGVGISAPAAKMHVAADAAGNFGQLSIGGFTNTNKLLQLGFNTTTDKGYIQATIAGSTVNDLLLNPAGGNVGVGIGSPAAKLDIAGTIKVADGSQGAGKVLTSDANGLATWATPTASTSTNIYNSDGTLTGARTVTLANNSLNFTGGNIGIGTASPYGLLANTSSNYGDVNTFGLNGTGFNWLTTTGAGYAGSFVNGANTGSANGLLVRVSNNASTALDVSYNPAATGGGTSLLRVNSNGFTGIGNSSPARPLDVNAGSNPIRFSSLAATASTTNVLAIDASGDIRSIPVTSLAVTAPSAGPQVTGPSGGYAATGNESIIFAGSGVTLAAPTAAQIGHSITILPSWGTTTVFSGSIPYGTFSTTSPTVPYGQRVTITGIVTSRYAGGANVWAVTAKDF